MIAVEIDNVFFNGFALRDHISRGIYNNARSVENQAVISSDLVHHYDRNFVILGNGGQHVAAKFPLAEPERRRGDIEHEIAARLDQSFNGIKCIKALVPEMFIVPGVFANGERHLFAAEWK